jgi:hypothetical protein
MTQAEIKALKSLSENYEGTPFDNIFKENYTGADKVMRNMTFKFKLVNGSGSAAKICLNPAMYSTLGITTTTTAAGSPLAYTSASVVHHHDLTEINAAGHALDAIIDDGTIATNITCAGSRKKVRDFMNFIRKNTVFVPEITLSADDPAAWDGELVIKNVSPFRELGDQAIISLSDYYSEYQQQNKKITLKLAADGTLVFFDDQTLIYLLVGAGRTIDVTLRCGMINNPSADYANSVLQGLGIQ